MFIELQDDYIWDFSDGKFKMVKFPGVKTVLCGETGTQGKLIGRIVKDVRVRSNQ